MTASNPISFICPLTGRMLRDPVTAEDGFIYESDAIKDWIRKYEKSPNTGNKLNMDALQPNLAVKAMLDKFKKALKSKDCKFKLNVDVRKERRTLSKGNGKAVFKANWLLTEDMNGPPIVILRLESLRAQIEAKFYEKFSCHPHILHTYGFVEQDSPDPNSIMLLQDYAPEGDLYEVLKEETPTESVLCEIFWQVANGMKYLAYKNVIHGDLACRNVLVFRFNNSEPKYNLVKLGDFGLSKGTSMYTALHNSSSLTSINTIPVGYAAPEVFTNNLFSEKSDMYSMGVLMWEAYSKGACPWGEIVKDDVVRQKVISGERLTQPSQCSDNVWSIVWECMSKNPEDRPTFLHLERKLRSHLKSKLAGKTDSVVEHCPTFSFDIISYPNGSKYEGELKNGKRHGQGIFTYADGRRYEGEFQNGKRHGYGTYTSSPNRCKKFSYVGQFVNDKFDGQASANYGNNDSYTGTFVKDRRHGQGIYQYANGARYEGVFENGKRHGHGIYTSSPKSRNCFSYKGQFANDKFQGTGSLKSHKGYSYDGEFKEGMADGHGIITDTNGYRYEGKFTNNTFCDNKTTYSMDQISFLVRSVPQ